MFSFSVMGLSLSLLHDGIPHKNHLYNYVKAPFFSSLFLFDHSGSSDKRHVTVINALETKEKRTILRTPLFDSL